MRRRHLIVRGTAAGLLAALFAVGVAAQPARPGGAALPYRLVALSPDGIPAALGKVEQGTLVRLAAADFDRLTRPGKATATPGAALLATRYRGRVTLDGGDPVLSGTGEWVVRGPGPGAALHLPALLTPVRQAKWSDGRDAVLFKPPRDDRPRLVVPAAGDLSLNLDWSARGLAEPGEVRFDLRVPPSPVATLDLELPAGYVPVVPPDEALLTGPFPADRGSAWRLAFGGSDRLVVVLRRVDDDRPRLFAKVEAFQRLTAGEGTAQYEVQVDSAKIGFADLEFTFDAGLTPTAVTVNNLATWAVAPGDGPTRRLLVRLTEPTRSASVTVAGTFAVPRAPAAWVSPALAVTGAVSRGESLHLSVGSALRFRDWRPGDYRLVRAERGLTGPYLLTVEPEPLPPDRATPVRPSLVVVRPPDSAWKIGQRAEWAVGPTQEEWSVRGTLEVTAGTVAVAAFGNPAGWTLDRAEVDGAEATADATTDPARLSIDLGRPVPIGETVEVTTRFRRRRDARPADEGLPFPDLVPVGAAGRDGRLSVHVDATLDAVASDPTRDESRPAPPAPGTFERPLTAEPLVGKLFVRPRATRPTAEVRTEWGPGATGVIARTTLTVRPGGGSVGAITLWAAHVPAGPWVWRDALGRRIAVAVRQPGVEAARRLAGLGSRTPVGSALSLAAAGFGSVWSVHLPRPTTEPTTLTTEYAIDEPDPLPGPWVLGLPLTGTVRSAGPGGERTRHYGTETGGREASPDEPPAASFDDLRLLTVVSADGPTEAAFRFRVRSGPAALPVRLPDGARLKGVTVAGRPAPIAGGRDLSIPVPRSAGWTEIEIRYAGPDFGQGLFVRPGVEPPEVPFDTRGVRRVWHLSPAWRVAARGGAVPVPGTRVASSDLPLPDWRAAVPAAGAVDLGEAARPGATLRDRLPATPFVLDTFALAGAGITMDTPVPPATPPGRFLADRGLTAVEVGGTTVLTTPANARSWRHDEPVALALADATRFGRDASGRFRTMDRADGDAPDWPAPEGWEVWTSDDPAAPLLVRADRIAPTASVVAVGLFLFTLALRARPRVRFAVLVLWSGLAVAGVVLGGDAVAEGARPLLFGALAAGLVGGRRTPVSAGVERPSHRPGVAGGAVALVLAAGVYAAEPVPVVYQLPAEAGRPAAVLVPPELLDRLRQPGGETVDVAITAADYVGAREGSACRFQARFRLWAFGDEATKLTLPLHAVKLREVRLDGAEAGGVSVGPEGLTVAVAGRGEHTLDVRFEVPVGAVGADREVKFAVPEVPISRLQFELPRAGLKLRPGPWRGAVRTTLIREAEHLDVDLGLAASVRVRWQADGAEKAAPVRAREAAVWRVANGALRLDSLTELRTTGAGPGEVQFAVPAAAEVYRVAVRSEGPAAARIQAWSLAPPDGSPFRTLTITFPGPLDGRVLLELEMYATGRPADRPALHLPRLLKVADVESQAALAVPGLTAAPPVETAGLAGVPPDGFVKGIWAALGGGPVRPVLAFRATGPGPTRLTPVVRLPAARTGAASEVTWWVEENRLVGRATSRVPGSAGLGLVEWRVRAGVVVTDVGGPRLVHWAQVGDRVQAWFDRPALDATIRWTAERPRAGPGADIAIPVPDFGPGSAAAVRVRPTGGLALGGRGSGEPLPPTAPGEMAWKVTSVDAGRLTVWAPQAAPLALATAIRRTAEDLDAVTTIDLTPLSRDRPHRLSVSVEGAGGAVVSVGGAGGAGLATAEVPSESGGRRWDVAVPGGRTTDSLAVAVRLATAKGAVPKVSVSSGPGGLPGRVTAVRVDPGEAALADHTGLARLGPSEWRVTSPVWGATVVRRTGTAGRGSRLSSGVVRAARAGATWAYLGRFEVSPDEFGPTSVSVPPGGTPVSIHINGKSVPVEYGRAVIPDGPGPHAVVVRWTTTAPAWNPPRFGMLLGAADAGPIDWVVSVPPGLRVEGEPSAAEEAVAEEADDEGFRYGIPVGFHSPTGAAPDVRLVPEGRPWLPAALAFGLWACFAFLMAWPSRFRPERAAALGALGGVTFGPAGAALWVLVVAALGYRGVTVLARVRGRAKSVP